MTKAKTEALADPPRFLRSRIARGLSAGSDSPIVRDGGDFGAGLIRGFAVITRGEALGHGFWIDSDFLDSVVSAMGSGDGLKARFTHPGLSSDGLGKKLGRAKGLRLEGDVVRGDLHFSKASHTTPDGDLSGHVMDLAEEDPESFGTSIVFEPDWDAEDEHYRAHVNPTTGRFASPDPLNERHLPHARLSKLYAVDVVDDPAANPGGMFHATQIPAEAEALMAYALGLSSDRPELFELAGVHPDRMKAFAERFLHSRGLSVMPQSEAPATTPAETPAVTEPAVTPPAETPATGTEGGSVATTPATETPPVVETPPVEKPEDKLGRFVDTFGAADGATWFREGLSFEEALGRSHAKLRSENEQLRQQRDAALAASGEQNPVSVTPAETKTAASAGKSGVLTEGQAAYAATIKLPGRG